MPGSDTSPSGALLDVVLYQPEIPPNTGNIIRLCANTGCRLHLVRPLGFSLRNKQLERASLDYRGLAGVAQHADWRACCEFFTGRRLFAVSTRGTLRYDQPEYRAGDVLVFGPETRGLPDTVLAQFAAEQRVRVPMLAASRSLNLANTVAIVVYEAWRQLGYAEGA